MLARLRLEFVRAAGLPAGAGLGGILLRAVLLEAELQVELARLDAGLLERRLQLGHVALERRERLGALGAHHRAQLAALDAAANAGNELAAKFNAIPEAALMGPPPGGGAAEAVRN